MLSAFHVVSVALTLVTVAVAVEPVSVSCEAEVSSSRSLLQSKVDLVPPKAMVFYNLFAENMFQVPRVAKIARGQLALVDPKHYDLSINSIGAITDVSQLALDPLLAQRTRFVHYIEGQETLTLHDVWSYCRRHDVLPSQAGHFLWHRHLECGPSFSSIEKWHFEVCSTSLLKNRWLSTCIPRDPTILMNSKTSGETM